MKIEVGIQVVSEIYGCNPDIISKKEVLGPLLDKIVEEVGLTVITHRHHQFKPGGVTSFYMLAESHLALHTWPEYGYCALDIFTCGDRNRALEASRKISKVLEAEDVKERVILRGVEEFEQKIKIEKAVTAFH
ncbi:S-adenosylmethionine decarboxylase proenzyme precursor [archaeon]|nr:S-adenosylmethionine decarboxylase proenzyme precursor [archaeon]